MKPFRDIFRYIKAPHSNFFLIEDALPLVSLPDGTILSLQHFMLPFCLGLTAMATQIILLREFMVLFQGNELVIGILLSAWMLLTGLGAWLGKFHEHRKCSLRSILNSLVGLAFLAMVILFASDALKNRVFPTGSMIGIEGIFLGCFLLLSPYCLLSGFLFTSLVAILSSSRLTGVSARVYAFESVGSLVGGLLLNFILVFFLRPFQSLLFIFILLSIISSFMAFRSSLRNAGWYYILTCMSVVVLVLWLNPDKLSRKLLFPGQEIKFYKDTPFGNLLVTQTAEQLNFFCNNSLLFTRNEIITNEESVHYAMLQRPDAGSVLLVEGGLSGIIKEILKYPVREIQYVEINPWIVKLGETYASEITEKRVKIYEGDIRHFLTAYPGKFDIVLLSVSEPSTLLANRFYSVEFFTLLKKRMNLGAVCSIGFMPSTAYLGEESRQVQALVFRTLGAVFPQVLVIPGEKNYFLASGNPLTPEVARLAAERNIPTDYVNGNYLEDDLIQQRSRGIMNSFSIKGPINEDFKPEAYYEYLRYWLSYFSIPVKAVLMILVSLLFILMICSNTVQLGIMVTGYTSVSLEIILLFIFQVVFGYMFLMIGVILLLFMGGLFLGSISRVLLPGSGIKPLVILQSGIAVICLIISGFPRLIGHLAYHTVIIHSMILLMVLVTAILAGLQFKWATNYLVGRPQKVSGSIYSSDLLGSAGGALFTSVIFIPVLGIQDTLLMMMAINILTAAWIYFRRNPSIVM